MRIILTSLLIATMTSGALAENDRALNDRLERFIRSEWDRQDCMWRETLQAVRSKDDTAEDIKRAAGNIALACSKESQKRILENMTPATELPQGEAAGFDLFFAQQRAIAIRHQIDGLGEAKLPKPPN